VIEIRLLILDVDGVLTRGDVTPGPSGDQGKAFNVRDGVALKLWQRAGGVVAFLSGRHCEDVTRRAEELGISIVRQGIADKAEALRSVLEEAGVGAQQAAYAGDDLPDIPVMSRCAIAIAVGDASPEVKRAAHFVTRRRGGEGAVAEAVEWLLRKQGRWDRERLYSL